MSIKNIDRVNARLSYFLKQLTQQYHPSLKRLHRTCRIDDFPMNNVIKKVNAVGSTPVEKVNQALIVLRDTQKDFIEHFGKLISMNITTDKGHFNNTARKELLRNIQCLSNNFYLDVQGVIDEEPNTKVVNKCNKDNLYDADLVHANYKDACLADRNLFLELRNHLVEWKKTLMNLKKQLKSIKHNADKKNNANKKKNNAAKKVNKKLVKKPAQPKSRPVKPQNKPLEIENIQSS
ncbi:uncharacterized protein LOC143918209 [Arctopsyche grandis]|uniref:uncharacterized protein LOC143918209 n=1 Tax=Arctopsyche grandis TaxID=121162 RepID=UPI00406DA153